jgi:retron-type reverse transcriptase
VDADIKGYFDNIDHELLIKFIREEITDGWVLGIIK